MVCDDGMRFPGALLRDQLQGVFLAWGMPVDQVEVTTRIMVEADLRGIDSHGIATLPLYDQFRQAGKLTMNPEVRTLRESPVTALLDGGGGLGHWPSHQAINLAVDKCARTGIGVVCVRNSNHFGAAGIYALRAAERGFIGMATTSVWRPGVVPTFGAEPMLGTNPIAFAAPAKRHPAFCLDMATSTVAIGKIKLAALQQRPIKDGWATDDKGRITTNASEAMAHLCLTPLGGIPEMSSHKGYGLATMVEILSTVLPGAFFAPTRDRAHPDAARYNVGHFFLALDPRSFRENGEFESDLDEMIDALHATKPAADGGAVMVAGDPEEKQFAERSRDGIPVAPELARQIHGIAEACGAAFLLGEA